MKKLALGLMTLATMENLSANSVTNINEDMDLTQTNYQKISSYLEDLKIEEKNTPTSKLLSKYINEEISESGRSNWAKVDISWTKRI